MWDPHSGNPLFWPSKAFIHSNTHINIQLIMVDGRFLLKKVDSNDLLFLENSSKTANSNSNRTEILPFDLRHYFRHHKRKTDILYKLPSPGFEPTTFLFHDLRRKTDALDRSATIGRPQQERLHMGIQKII